jgi:protein-S-isoprenylcysteine O-methyltransferase Ste14
MGIGEVGRPRSLARHSAGTPRGVDSAIVVEDTRSGAPPRLALGGRTSALSCRPGHGPRRCFRHGTVTVPGLRRVYARLNPVALFIQNDHAARDLLIATVALSVTAESWATYLGHAASDRSMSGRLRNGVEALFQVLVPSNRGHAPTVDRGTKRTLVLGTVAGGAVAVWIAYRFPRARWGANDWFGVAIGITIAVAGIAVRAWAVKTLGRYFQREVVIEPGQTMVRSGPYRWVRHPAYSGNLLALFGFGVAGGSWIGALAGTLIALVAHLPRIRVEEQALRDAFRDSYAAYAAETARIIPFVW